MDNINEQLSKNGVIFIDIKNTYISDDSVIEPGVILYPNVYIEKKTIIGKGSVIMPGSFITNSKIGENTKVISSTISDSVVGNFVEIGPNAHIRNNCVIKDMCRIGNFVELKNTIFGFKSKVAHLSYLGDSVIGDEVNVGCGVVTVNYDGKDKHKTIIGNKSFIGSNANLIAPIIIGKEAVVAAGSTVNKDVLDGELAISRSIQINKKDYGYKYIRKGK